MTDTHAHLDDPRFDADRDEVVARAHAAGVRSVVVPGLHAGQWRGARDLARRHGLVYAVGTHPWALGAIEAGAPLVPHDTEDALAIGECGLDGTIATPLADQEAALRVQLSRARDLGLPVILHCVRAHDAMLALLRTFAPLRGVLHAYSGGVGRVPAYVATGLHLAFGGAITWEGARRPVEALRAVPRERLLAESDAPDQCPRPWRGRSEPAYLPEVVAAMERLRGEPLRAQLDENVATLGW